MMLQCRTLAAVVAAAAVAIAMALPAGAAQGTFEDALAAYDTAVQSKDKSHEGYATAYEIWSDLAESGDTKSRYHLGILHMYGLGGAEFDQYLALDYVRGAAEEGYGMAQSLMGFFAENGAAYAMMQDEISAREWYRKGAESGHCVSVRRLARAYREGELGLEPDPARAEHWNSRVPDCNER